MRDKPAPFKYDNDFAVVNKSYLKDLQWSVVMYRSWRRFAYPITPFFMIVPGADLSSFREAFKQEIDLGRVDEAPRMLAEEDLFSMTDIVVPSFFGGWHRQQIVKFCFSKSSLAKRYFTVDSSIIFTREFDYRQLISDDQIFTSAMPVRKDDFFANLRRFEQKGWLDGRLAGIDECFERICSVMNNSGEMTNAYISCTGLFDSDTARDLELFARGVGLDGYVGLLMIAPYEFAWYGEFVFSQHPYLFKGFGPHLMTLAESQQDADRIIRREIIVQENHFGVMFQPPATDVLMPDRAYDLLLPATLRKKYLFKGGRRNLR